MDKVSKAILTMIAVAIFSMSLLIAYGANDMKLAHEAKIAHPPKKAVEAVKEPEPSDRPSNEEPDIEIEDEDFGDFGKPIIDLDGENTDENDSLQNATDASAEEAVAAGAAAEAAAEAAAAAAGLAAESTSE